MADIEETDAEGQALAQTARYDDFIMLFCDDGPGFVFSQVTSTAHAKWAVARQGDKDVQNSNFSDLHSAAFQIIGATKFKAAENLRKVQSELKKTSDDEYTSEERKQLAKEKQRARKEIEDNRQERARQSGKPIQYGQIIQLHHQLSKRYLAVSTTQTSSLEHANMQLDLAEDSSSKSQFLVLPCYKVRSVGDPVHVGDQIYLESVKTAGQFLHCSKSNFGTQHVESSCRELNLSATQSALTFLMQFSPFGKVEVEAKLRGGSVIRLFHRELEAYLTAEGAFYMDEPVQDVHLRVRPQVSDRPRSLEPPSSAITYWQVELDEKPTSVELSGPETKELAQLVGDTIHYDDFYLHMHWMYTNRECEKGEPNVIGYRIVHFLMRLNDFAPKRKKWILKPDFEASRGGYWTEEFEESWTYFRKATLSIELVHSGALQRVYFAAEFQGDLRQEVKTQLKWNIKRDSAPNKLRDFLTWSNDIREDMEYQGQLTQEPIANFFVKHSWHWAFAMLMLTYIINIFMLATWQAPVFLYDILPETPSYYDAVIYLLGSLHLVFSLCVTISFFIANLKNFTLPSLKLPSLINYRKSPAEQETGASTADNQQSERTPDKERSSVRSTSDIERHNQLSLVGIASLYHVCIVAFSAASIPLKGYFYCFHLLHIVVNNDTLTRVLQSVTRPGKQLVYVAVLALFIIYIYSVASFGLLKIFFDREEGLFCETLGQCYATSIRFGLLSTLGDVISNNSFAYKEVGLRIIFDLTFFIIITTIGLNIVFGLIVDSFSALRDEKNAAVEDMNSTCFMCSLSSHEFEKRAKGFDHHVDNDHSMWAYLFYFIHLHQLEAENRTATEDFVYWKYKAGDIDFFPTNQALCLENVEVGNEEQLDQRQLNEMVTRLVHRIDREEDEERRKKARDEQRKWEMTARRSMDGARRISSMTGPVDVTDGRASAVRTAADMEKDKHDDDESCL